MVFYVADSRQTWGRYLEVACAGWSDGICGGGDLIDPLSVWGCFSIEIGGTKNEIGEGRQNTANIVGGCPAPGIPARLSNDLVLGGQSDWFLPSTDEQTQMFLNETVGNGFSNGPYWSSSEVTGTVAFGSGFFGGRDFDVVPKSSGGSVRPVRAF
jgi:hypothetical protein